MSIKKSVETIEKSNSVKKLSKIANNPILLIILAFITILSFTIQLWPKTQRYFTYDLNSTILVGGDSLISDIEIFYKNNIVSDIQSSNIIIKYIGKEPIKKNDIATLNPFSIQLEDQHKIYDVKLIETTNIMNDVSINWNKDIGKITIDFEFFNNGDCITIQILHSSSISPLFDVTIIGNSGKSLMENNNMFDINFEPMWYFVLSVVVLIIHIILSIFSIYGIIEGIKKPKDKDMIIIALVLFLFCLLNIIYIILGRII